MNSEEHSDRAPDWFEQFVVWLDRYGGVAGVGAIVCLGLFLVIARSEASAQNARAAEERDAIQIRKHMAWLRGLPDAEKRTWPAASYCHPAATQHGVCRCDPEWATAEVTWPERLENGDIACHATR